ncbi:MAG TPA: zinc ribbon domain-containing protein [Anaerolineales bacterium]|nr:zinc ribbon domain-containing protein [Anaerolineales bacterium]
MDLGSLFFLIALFILVAIFIARPLLDRKAVGVTEEEQAFSTWLARRDRVLDALQELDFDYKLGKIPEADYPVSRAALLQQGAEILKIMDASQPQPKSHPDALEAAIAARREQLLASPGNGIHNNTVHHPDDDIEALLATRRRTRKTKSAGFCSQCGHPIQTNDKFCSKCGVNL